MNIVNTQAPISIDNLKLYFADRSIQFNIDYAASKIQGEKLLIYFSNLDIPVDLVIDKKSDHFFPLLKTYFELSLVVSIPALEMAAIELLLAKKEIIDCQGFYDSFIEENEEIISKWESVLESLTLYNLKIVNGNIFEDFISKFPIENADNKGVNFVSLLKHEVFYLFYHKIDEMKLKNYHNLFTEQMFKGKNLYSFWANGNNPLFLLTFGIASGLIENTPDGPKVKDFNLPNVDTN